MKALQQIKNFRTKDLRQVIFIKTTPNRVYDALTIPKLHSRFTDSKAINTDKLGIFSAYDGYAFGENIQLIKNKKIVQTWASTDWPKGHYSQVTYEFKQEGNKTKVKFIQKDIPSSEFKGIKTGWKEFYWNPLKSFLEK